jgi:hypothetical protein
MTLPKGDWKSIVGRQVTADIVCQSNRVQLRTRVHLVFSDGSTFEIYANGGTLSGSSHLYRRTLPEVVNFEEEGAELWVFDEPS